MDDNHHVSVAPARYRYPSAWKWFYLIGLIGISLLLLLIIFLAVYAIRVGDMIRHNQLTHITYGDGEGLFTVAIIAVVIGVIVGVTAFIYVGYNLSTHPHIVHGATNVDFRRGLANFRLRNRKRQTTLPDESGMSVRDIAKDMDVANREIKDVEVKEGSPPVRESIPAPRPIPSSRPTKVISSTRRVSRKPTSTEVSEIQDELRDAGIDLDAVCKALTS